MNKEKEITFYLTKEDGSREEFVIGPEGSLGILAMGAVGVKAWKQAKAKMRKEKKKNTKEKLTNSSKEKK